MICPSQPESSNQANNVKASDNGDENHEAVSINKTNIIPFHCI